MSDIRFVSLIKSVVVGLCAFLQSVCGEKTGIYCIASMHIKACHIRREKQHRVFKGIAKQAKTTIGGFFGFTLHFIIHDQGKLITFT